MYWEVGGWGENEGMGGGEGGQGGQYVFRKEVAREEKVRSHDRGNHCVSGDVVGCQGPVVGDKSTVS